MPDWYEELKALFKTQIGKGEMAGTAYDTAWVASIPDPEHPDRPAFPGVLEWLRLHQHSDGSWGAEVQYSHDRILSTLASILALPTWCHDEWADYQIEAGIRSIWRQTNGLQADPYETVGFDLVMPTLLDQARAQSFNLPYSFFEHYRPQRERKMRMIPPELQYSRDTTLAFTFEFLGNEIDLGRIDNTLQEDNGSIACSPSATSYYLRHKHDLRAWNYLKQVVSAANAIPMAAPVDVFESAWALYNLYLVEETLPIDSRDCIEHLAKLWKPTGVSFGHSYSVPDFDDTVTTYLALTRAGQEPYSEVFSRFELDDHFWCFQYERDASPSVHSHLVEVLKICRPFPDRDRMLAKALSFLRRSQVSNLFWFDKWHASPYYTTAHTIIAAADIDPGLVEQPTLWLTQTQRPDGSWGYLTGTAEETAYVLQALVFLYRRRQVRLPVALFKNAVEYLEASTEWQAMRYEPLWIGKTLYYSTWVVHSAVLSALAMTQRM